MRILVVEDDSSSRQLMQHLLSTYGDCRTAGNGQEAVHAFRSAIENGEPYDLVCLDIQMPKLNGHEALQSIRQIEKEKGITGPAKAKVIMTTAEEGKPAITEALMKGASWYLIKPVTREKLASRLRNLGIVPEQ